MKLPTDADPVLQQAIGEVDREFQRSSHKVFDREPKATEIPDQGFVLAKIAGTVYIYTRFGTQRYRTQMTAV